MRPSELNTTMIRSCATRLLDSDTSWQPDGYAFLLVLDGALALQSADPDLCGSDTLYIIPDRQKVIIKPQNNASVFFLVLRAETMLACTGTEEIFHVTTRLLPETRRQEIRLTLRQLREEVAAASDPEDHARSFSPILRNRRVPEGSKQIMCLLQYPPPWGCSMASPLT